MTWDLGETKAVSLRTFIWSKCVWFRQHWVCCCLHLTSQRCGLPCWLSVWRKASFACPKIPPTPSSWAMCKLTSHKGLQQPHKCSQTLDLTWKVYSPPVVSHKFWTAQELHERLQKLHCTRTQVSQMRLSLRLSLCLMLPHDMFQCTKSKWELESHPSAKAPDHCRRKPSKADIRMVLALLTSHTKDNAPGGSNHGIKASKKKIVTGVVFHINLQSKVLILLYIPYEMSS